MGEQAITGKKLKSTAENWAQEALNPNDGDDCDIDFNDLDDAQLSAEQLDDISSCFEEQELEDDQELHSVQVWEVNWDAFQVFRLCHWEHLLDQGVLYRTGISATEISEVSKVLGISQDQLAYTHHAVQYMAAVAGPILNAASIESAQRAARKGK